MTWIGFELPMCPVGGVDKCKQNKIECFPFIIKEIISLKTGPKTLRQCKPFIVSIII